VVDKLSPRDAGARRQGDTTDRAEAAVGNEGGMTMSKASTRPTQSGFYRKCHVWHAAEIELAVELTAAIRLTIGKQAARRIAKKDPAKLFARLRYGRNVMHTDSLGSNMEPVADNALATGGKAPRRWIMTPARREWGAFLDRMVGVMTRSSHYREDARFAAAAQALDDAGFAIAESIAVAMLFEAEGDEDIVYTTKVVWRGERKPFDHHATPAR